MRRWIFDTDDLSAYIDPVIEVNSREEAVDEALCRIRKHLSFEEVARCQCGREVWIPEGPFGVDYTRARGCRHFVFSPEMKAEKIVDMLAYKAQNVIRAKYDIPCVVEYLSASDHWPASLREASPSVFAPLLQHSSMEVRRAATRAIGMLRRTA